VIYFFASQLDFTNIKSKEAELAAARHLAEEEVKKRTADLQRALETKTALVHEVDHRVKNNLMTIASIVKVQARMSDNETARKTLRSVLELIEALSTVQRKILNNDVGHFDVAELARELSQDRIGGLKRKDIAVTMDLHEVIVPAAKASPIAIVINELLGNTLRRGLRDGGGEIHIEVRRLNEHLLIRVNDTVSPVDVDLKQQAFSALMLETSAHQLGAEIQKTVEGDRTDVRVTVLVDEHDD
jgi:two-component sensor histidine kinase